MSLQLPKPNEDDRRLSIKDPSAADSANLQAQSLFSGELSHTSHTCIEMLDAPPAVTQRLFAVQQHMSEIIGPPPKTIRLKYNRLDSPILNECHAGRFIDEYSLRVVEVDGNRRLQFIKPSFTSYDRVGFSFTPDDSTTWRQESHIAHELFHVRTPSAPLNELIMEGIAVLGESLYANKRFAAPWRVHGMNDFLLLDGSFPGLQLGDGIFNSGATNSNWHTFTGIMGAGLLARCLGGCPDILVLERNFKELVRVSNLEEGGMLSTAEWVEAVDTVVPGFSRNFYSDLVITSSTDSSVTIWVMDGLPNAGKSSWGTVFNHSFEANRQRGLTLTEYSWGVQPTIHDFDLSQGRYTAKPMAIRLLQEGKTFAQISTDLGYLRINPECLAHVAKLQGEFGYQDFHTRIRSPFSIEIEVSNNEWRSIGNNFFVDQRDEFLLKNKVVPDL